MTDSKKYLIYAGYLALATVVLAASVDYSFYLAPSGLVIPSTVVPWDPANTYLAAFAVASGNSLAVGLISIALATVLGVLIGMIGVWNNPTATVLYRVYVGGFRNVPVLFVILLFYFIGIALPAPAKAPDLFGLVFVSNRGLVLPSVELGSGLGGTAGYVSLALVALALLLAFLAPVRKWQRLAAALLALIAAAVVGLDFHAPERGKFGFTSGSNLPLEFMALTAALSMYYAAEIAEITRGSILSINKGIIDASHALGLHAFDRFQRIVAPLALRFGLPSALNTYLVVLKATSLGVAIGYTELFSVARLSMSSSGRVLECLSLMGLYFLLMCGTLSFLVNRINEKLKRWSK